MKRKQIQIATWSGALLAGGALLYNVPPSTHSFYPRCPFYAATHLLCPGCGGTRALYEMLHGNFSGALHFNALVTMLSPLVLAWLAWSCYQAFRYDRFPPIPWPRTIALSFATVAFFFAVIRDTGLAFAI
jgi:hypothetical protein